MRASLSLSLIVWLFLGATLAHARGEEKRARELYDKGLRHYNIAEYDAAIAAFKEAYVLSNAPLLLFNIGQAYRLKGDCAEAMRFYLNYLREEPDPDNRKETEEAIALCEKPPAAAATPPPVETPPTAVDPPPPAPPAPAGAAPAPVPPRAADTPARPGRGKRIAGIVTGSVGVALVVTGVYFGVKASSLASDAENGGGTWDPSVEEDGERAALTANILWGVGGAAVVAGGVLYYLGHREAAAATRAALVPTPGGAAVVLSGTF